MFLSLVEWFKMLPLTDYFEKEGDHANEMETSIIMHYFPELVLPLREAGEGKSRKFKIEGLNTSTAWAPRHWTKVSEDTGIGDPREASPEKGKKFLEAITSAIGSYFVDLAASENDHPTSTFLQWFVTEQVEEEATAQGIVEKLEKIGDNPMGMFMMDGKDRKSTRLNSSHYS